MPDLAGKYARFELERRFLVTRLPDGITDNRGWRITDRYIPATQLRLRRMEPLHQAETIFKLGQKQMVSPSDFIRTTITNIYLSADEYALLTELGGTRNSQAPLFSPILQPRPQRRYLRGPLVRPHHRRGQLRN